MEEIPFFNIELSDPLLKVLIFLAAIVVAVILSHIATRLIRKTLDATAIPNASIFINIARAFIWAFCLLAIMQPVFGVTPNAFMTAIGVTSLAISLGLQDTISNIVSGLELMVGKVIKVGDFIEVSGFRGEVIDINWRSTTLRNRYGDEQVIPNSALNEAALTRLDYATATKYIANIVVDHDANLDVVTNDIRTAARKALEGQLVEKYSDGVRVEVTGSDVYGTQVSIFLYLKDDIVPYMAIDTAMRQIADKPWMAREH